VYAANGDYANASLQLNKALSLKLPPQESAEARKMLESIPN
jgi:hypothetical protein